MLITFTCTAYENITMFGDIAKRLLTLMGHSATVPGAFSADEVPEALSRLKAGIELKGQQPSQNQQDDEEEPISLANRALPLIQMLEAAAKAKKSVLWS